jgi:hypothetical protein
LTRPVTRAGVHHEPRPELYRPLLARFALAWHERALARLLVSIAAVPGAMRLLTAWHGRRAKK